MLNLSVLVVLSGILGFPCIVCIYTMHLHLKAILPFPYRFGYLLFLFQLLWLGLTILNRRGESGYSWNTQEYPFQILAGRLSAFHYYYVDHGFVIVFMMLRYVPSIPTSIKVFIINGCCWILSNALSVSVEMTVGFLSFVDVAYHIDYFVYVELSKWPTLQWIQPGYGTWTLFCWIWLANHDCTVHPRLQVDGSSSCHLNEV